MKVTKIILAKQNVLATHMNAKDINQNYSQNHSYNYSYNPMAYKDFNIAFTANKTKDNRKHWTPEEFYDLPTNKKFMPHTMKKYLEDDFKTRYHLSPIRVMSEAFQQIENLKSLDEVKEYFNDEKLFKNLTSTPYKNARKGILAEKRVFGDMGALFADGTDDLGMYLLKKIYLEGKQLPEINNDFKKDVANIYKGALSEIADDDLYAHGIRRPEFSFWQSLTHNREDFPYEYKPRTLQNAPKTDVIKEVIPQIKQHRKFNEVQKFNMSQFMRDMWKNLPPEEAQRRIKRLKLGEEESFFHNYKCPIMVIAADKINLGAKLSEFMTNAYKPENIEKLMTQVEQENGILLDFQNPNDKIKTIMKSFWKSNPELDAQFGKAIKETIVEFEDAYAKGIDSKELTDLLKNADELKEASALKLKEYSRLRRKEIQTEELKKLAEETEKQKIIPEKIIRKEPIVKTLKDEFKEAIYAQSKIVPEKYIDSYYRYLERSTLLNEDIMRKFITAEDDESVKLIFGKINEEIETKSFTKLQAARQAVIDFVSSTSLKTNSHRLYQLDLNEIVQIINNLNIEIKPQDKQMIDKAYTEYITPFKNSAEIDKIIKKTVSALTEFKMKDVNGETGNLVALLSANVQEKPAYKVGLEKILKKTHFIENYGVTAKTILNENIERKVLMAKIEHIVVFFITRNAQNEQLRKMLISSPENTDSILKTSSVECYNIIKTLEKRLGKFRF